MDLTEAMKTRHSVRRYRDQPLSMEAVSAMQAEIDACNHAGRLHSSLD